MIYIYIFDARIIFYFWPEKIDRDLSKNGIVFAMSERV